MTRWIMTLLIVAVVVPVLVADTATAGSKDGGCTHDKRKPGWDNEITEFIYDVTIPWPFRKHAGDADGDGVADNFDKCPDTPKGAKVDARGCPMDSDGDGVFDGIDKCADTPKGTEVDKEGCPISKVEKAMINTGVFSTTEIVFDTDKAVIKPGSYKILGELGATLAAHPELEVEIGGHTDSTGEEPYNQTLSERRARAVLDYLVEEFSDINKGQLLTKGYGEGSPVASNDTADGRAKNRRVEFKVLKK
jgi:OOP family OmpA-OmpF porin